MDHQGDISWRRARELLASVFDLPREQRRRAVQAAEVDDALKRVVLSMLEAFEQKTEPSTVQRTEPVTASAKVQPIPWGEGDKLGAYRLERPLGQGGMGTVFIAQRNDDAYSKNVAIKVIRHRGVGEEALQRFRAERQIMADLEHPSIARLLDGGETSEGFPYLVLEYIEGLPIDAYCRQYALPMEARLDLFLEVCRAVQFAHQNLIVHRDLKPSNILVTTGEQGSGTSAPGVKLLDFGIAKILEGSQVMANAGLTRTGSSPMTPAYAAPEQVTGGSITTATDVYSLGMLLYLLLTDDLPYRLDKRDMPAIVDRVVRRQVPRPSSQLLEMESDTKGPKHLSARALRGDLDAITLKALAKEPNARYATAEQLADDLERHLHRRPVRARRSTPVYRAGKFFSRYRLGFGAALSVFAVLIASLAALGHQQERLVAERDHALKQQQRAESISGYMVKLFQLSDPAPSSGEEITARWLLDRSRQTIDQELTDQPRLLSELLGTLARSYAGLGRLNEAHELLDRALQRVPGLSEDPLRIELLYELSEILRRQGQYPAARVILREMLTRLGTEKSAEQRALFLNAHAALGLLQARSGDITSAEETLSRSLELAREFDDPKILAYNYEYLGELHSYQDKKKEAEQYYKRSLAILRRLHDERHPDIVFLQAAIGGLEQGLSGSESREQLLRHAVSEQRRLYGTSHPTLATSLNNLAMLVAAQDRFDEAEPLYQESIAIKRDLLGTSHPSLATTLSNLARLKHEIGDLASAEALHIEALDIVELTLGKKHAQYGLGLDGLSVLKSATGDFEAAQALGEEAVETLLGALGGQHTWTLVARSNLADIATRQGRPEEAAKVLRKVAEEVSRLDGGSPELSVPLINLAGLEIALGREEEGIRLYSAVVKRDGDRTLAGLYALTHTAYWARQRGNWQQAIEESERAIGGFRRRGIDDTWILSAQKTQGLALLGLGRRSEAIAVLEARRDKIKLRRQSGLSSAEALEGAESDLERARSSASL